MTEHECTWCGLTGAPIRRLDAAGEEHWFHDACWRAQAAWVRGHAGLLDVHGPEDRRRGDQAISAVARAKTQRLRREVQS